jgi:glycogen synthase
MYRFKNIYVSFFILAFSTGGLKDTVFEFDSNTLQGNGFLFHNYSNEDFIETVIRAQTILKYVFLNYSTTYVFEKT